MKDLQRRNTQLNIFVTLAKLQDMTAAEIEKSTSHRIVSVLARILGDKLMLVLHVVHGATKEGLNPSLSSLIG